MRILAVLIGLLSCHSSAATLLLTTPSEVLIQEVQSSWLQCEEQVWCEDSLTYYRHNYYGQAERINGQMVLKLFVEYSSHQLSELQLNLRSDGFSLIHVDIAGEHFNVAQQFSNNSESRVDKALIEFINQFSPSQVRVMVWQNSFWDAKLLSDGEIITLSFSPR